MPEKSLTATLLWDRFGIGVSGICAIHCLLFPAFISVLPLWPALASAHEWIHPVFIILLIPIIYFAIRRSHFHFTVTTTLVTGFILATLGWLIGHFWLGLWVETSLTILGSSILITGHWINYHHHRHCNNSRHKHHPISENAERKESAGEDKPLKEVT